MKDEHKLLLLGAAGIEGGVYALAVYLAVTFTTWPIDFRPIIGGTYEQTIESTVEVLGLIWILGWIHKRFQKAITKYGPTKLSTGAIWVDWISSLLPGFALVLGIIVDYSHPPVGGYRYWALVYLAFIIVMVVDALKEDVQALWRYNK